MARRRSSTRTTRISRGVSSVYPAPTPGSARLHGQPLLTGTFESADASWQRLQDVLNDFDVALFLGAGLSVPNKIPAWQALTARLSNEAEPVVRKLQSYGVSLTTQLQLARQKAPGDDWSKRMRSVLYAGLWRQVAAQARFIARLSAKDFGETDKAARGRVRTFFARTNPVLLQIVEACAVDRDGQRKANDRIGAILTTNIDGLLQACDRACHGHPRMLRTVEDATKNSVFEKITLYHLHGYVNLNAAKPTPSDGLVLTEDEYLGRNDDPYSWASVVLHWALREFPIVFVGCSMTDELVRRALRRSLLERLHFSGSATRFHPIPEHRWRRQFAVVRRRKIHRANHAINDNLAFLGVWPLWVSDFKGDLQRRLTALGLAG